MCKDHLSFNSICQASTKGEALWCNGYINNFSDEMYHIELLLIFLSVCAHVEVRG